MSAIIHFTKMQGVGNDFVVVDDREGPGRDWSELATVLCDRRFGVGGDGLLVVGPSATADGRMRMFNPDGTEDFCGNGLRCVVRYLLDQRGPDAQELFVETIAGTRRATVAERDPEGLPTRISVEMGFPRFEPAAIPMSVDLPRVTDFPLEAAGRAIPITSLSTGTAHTVLFVDELPEDAEFFSVSPAIEHHPLFPERTSVLWAVIAPNEEIRLRIWERGVGETLGCGTGACAAAVAAIGEHAERFPSGRAAVHSKGGVLEVQWDPAASHPILLTGPAETVFDGNFRLR